MFSESDRVQIRKFLGTPAMFLQAEPRLESAISSVQAIADGGSRPDNSTELAIRSYLTTLATLETKMASNWDIFLGNSVGDVEADAVRGNMMLRSEARRYVGYLADALNFAPVRDVFSAAPDRGGNNPFGVGGWSG